MIKKLLLPLFLLVACVAYGQQVTIKGNVSDESTKEGLISATVLKKGTTEGTLTDLDGNFELQVEQSELPVTLVFSYVGYDDREITVNQGSSSLNIKLSGVVMPGSEVVITASRVSESILESPISIQKMTAADIQRSAAGDFYESIGHLKEVDMITASAGFKVFNTRGFNATTPVRVVQFIDGMDNQAPGLNFPVGNLVGISDIDLASVEVINGPASALYGANAFQGVISMQSKNPYDYPGLSIQLKGGNRSMYEGQFRYAGTYGKKDKLGFKFTGSYFSINDWEADDPEANLYGDIETEFDLSALIRELQFDSDPETAEDFIKLNAYMDFNPTAWPGIIDIEAPGYNEVDLADYGSNSLKLSTGLYYRFNDSLEASYMFKYGDATAIYQGTNRYSVSGIKFQQHRMELKGHNFFVRVYGTIENAGDSYDNVFTGINLSKAGIGDYVSEYLSEYVGVLDTLTNNFDKDAKQWMIDSAKVRALMIAGNAWLQPGTYKFDSTFNEIITNSDLQKGSKFTDESSLWHVEGQYVFDWVKALDLMGGAAFRFYNPQSYGTIFADTLVNPGDTLANGSANLDAEFVNLTNWEVGGYLQAQKKFFNDKVRLLASIRFDKNENFDLQFSPRGAIIINHKQHVIRFSGQSAFRTPTLQNQFIKINLGPIELLGNRNGHDNLFTLESVEAFQEEYDSTFNIDPGLLSPIRLAPLRPEQVKTIEVGYRTVIKNKFFIDLTAYLNFYDDFIGDIRVVQPKGGAIAGEESGTDAILTENYEVYQIPVNADQTVTAYGFSAGLSYYLGRGITAKGNYTWADLNTDNLEDPILPGFNTPNHKFNIGLEGRKIYKGLGFNANFKWSGGYEWQSTFGDGNVPSFYSLDAQISYEIDRWYSTIRGGGSNLTDNRFRTAYGSPLLGRLLFVSYTFEFSDFGNKKSN